MTTVAVLSREPMAACRAGDTLVVTKLDRLARSGPDAHDIVNELTRRGVKLNLGGSVHDPKDPVGRLLFNILAVVAEFEAVVTIGGYFGLVTAAVAWYACLAGVAASTFGRPVLPNQPLGRD